MSKTNKLIFVSFLGTVIFSGLITWSLYPTGGNRGPASQRPVAEKIGADEKSAATSSSTEDAIGKKELTFVFKDDSVKEIFDPRPRAYTFEWNGRQIGAMILTPDAEEKTAPEDFEKWYQGIGEKVTVSGVATPVTKREINGRKTLLFNLSDQNGSFENLMTEVDNQVVWFQTTATRDDLINFFENLAAINNNGKK